MSEEFAEVLKQAAEEAKKYDPNCVSVWISQLGNFVELRTNNYDATYSKTIPGIVGGDCGLICRMDNDEVIGIKLEVKTDKLVVNHKGPVKINEGFLKEDNDT